MVLSPDSVQMPREKESSSVDWEAGCVEGHVLSREHRHGNRRGWG